MATITEARIEELLPMVDEYTGDDRTDCRILQDTAMLKKLGWRVPSVTDWRYILAGIGGLESPTPTSPAGVKDGMEYGNGSTMRSAINAACGNTALRSDEYWSSSQRFDWSAYAWAYHFNDSKFYWTNSGNSFYVRAVFAY